MWGQALRHMNIFNNRHIPKYKITEFHCEPTMAVTIDVT